MGALASSTLGYEGISPAVLSDQRGMNKYCITIASGKGVAEDEGVVQSERPLVIVAVQGTSALRKIAVGNEQSAFFSVGILDDELVTSVVRLVNDGIPIACVADFNTFSSRLVNRL